MLTLYDNRVLQRDFLLEISRAMTAQLDLNGVLRLVLKASVAMLSGQVGLVALREPDDQYTIHAFVGIEAERLPELDKRLAQLVSSPDEGLDWDFVNAQLNQMALYLDKALRQSLFLPLVMGGQPIGLIIIFRAYWMQTPENDLQILQSFADQAAIAVHNAQLYTRMDQERKRLEAILDHGADGVMILDSQLRILRFNRALERMTGWAAQDAIGQNQEAVITWKRLEKGDLKKAMAEGWPYRLADDAPLDTLYVEGDLLRRDGMTLGIGITYAPLFNDDKRLDNIIANVHDITNFRRAQEMQDVFVSTVSHELKTPVALIKGYAGTLNREDASWEPQVVRDGLTVIEEEADRLTELIENLLATSKLRAERMQLDVSDVKLDALAGRVVERFQTQTTKHQFKLSFPPNFPVIQGDEVRLRQVLDNLVSNAIKYSPSGGTITVGGEMDEGYVTVFVRDEGIGIPENEQENIFKRFYRVDGTMTRTTKGTGLGLYLAQGVIEAHGGSIHVKSKPGSGSTFYFTIPI